MTSSRGEKAMRRAAFQLRMTVVIALGLLARQPSHAQPASFVNFETAPVHPVELSPDGRTLAVCNLPDGRVELFDVTSGIPQPVGDVPVGIDSVSVRWRSTNELWVVNHISSSISIVDVTRRLVVDTVQTKGGPADIVFAGTPSRAFVSCSRVNTVQVFDPVTRQCITNLVIDGERPKAMAVSPDGQRVYVAIFESGNASTILAPPITQLGSFSEAGPVGHTNGPYQGQNPPPNDGTAFLPPINPSIPTNALPPIVSHIVKKNASGRWMDDSGADWTEYISGANAHLSGRIEGWDLQDRDVAILGTDTFTISYACGLMNLCMDLAVNPASGKIAVVGTDATNERRFEPNLRATFLRVNLALFDLITETKQIIDLNPHLDYATRTLPQTERDKALGDPRGIVWNSTGTRGYVTGMGSRNLVVIDADGQRVQSQPIELGQGPTGLALDEARQRLYVLNRFSASLSVVDTASFTVLTNVPFFDPTPTEIKLGRRHFYDTRWTSGLGHVSCASCHPDGRMDRLAWDLGDPAGERPAITNYAIGSPSFDEVRIYHPMKGPMVTQTMQDIIGHEPFHWRADRKSIEEFNPTFRDLLGRDSLLTPLEMQEFKEFLASIHFPPNLYRNLDDTLPEEVPLAGLYGAAQPHVPLVTGNPNEGLRMFLGLLSGNEASCISCHKPPAGLGEDRTRFFLSPNGERHIDVQSDGRTLDLFFKVPQLRNLSEKVGLDYSGTNSRAGFGFFHDGRVDTLSQFLFRGFPGELLPGPDFELDHADPLIANLIAFLFCFSGSDLSFTESRIPIGPVSQDVATAAGRQITVTNSNAPPLLSTMLALGNSTSNRLDLVARGTKDGLARAWYFAGHFLSDRPGEDLQTSDLLALATPETPLTFTLVPRGSGRRLGIDRDGDGWPDRTELDAGYGPANPDSRGTNTAPRLALVPDNIVAHAGTTIAFAPATTGAPPRELRFTMLPDLPDRMTLDPVTGMFALQPDLPTRLKLRLHIRVTDTVWPFLDDTQSITLEAVPFHITSKRSNTFISFHWNTIFGRTYQLQSTANLAEPNWDRHDERQFFGDQGSFVVGFASFYQRKFFRVVLLP